MAKLAKRQPSKLSLRSWRSTSSSSGGRSTPSTPERTPPLPAKYLTPEVTPTKSTRVALSLAEELGHGPTPANSPASPKRAVTPSKAAKHTRYDVISPADMDAACRLSLLDGAGKRTTLGDELQLASHRRVVLVFIRHFWCVQSLTLPCTSVDVVRAGAVSAKSTPPPWPSYPASASPTPASASSSSAAVTPRSSMATAVRHPLALNPRCSHSHTGTTGLPAEYRLLADPTTDVYRLFGLMTSLDPGPADQAGAYVQRSMLANVLHSAAAGLRHPWRNPGPMSQLGGEFVFGSSRRCVYACRMTTTRDHGDLVRAAPCVIAHQPHSRSTTSSRPLAST
jgi:hypothetical protein